MTRLTWYLNQVTLLILAMSLSSFAASGAALTSESQASSTTYVLLNDSSFTTHHVEASATSIKHRLSPARSLEIYNILIPCKANLQTKNGVFLNRNQRTRRDTVLVALSILPNNQGYVSWVPIALDTIPAQSMQSLALDARKRLLNYQQAGNPLSHELVNQTNLLPIVHRDNQYWVPNTPVLTEYFIIRSKRSASLNNADYSTINIKSPKVPADAPWRTLRALHPEGKTYDHTQGFGIVLEKESNGIYSFWSYPPLTAAHTTIGYYGSSVFEYKPGIGLITGQYLNSSLISPSGGLKYFYDKIIVDGSKRLR